MTGGEAAALFVVCSVYLVRALTGAPSDRATAVTGAAMGLVFAVVLGLLARGLARRRRVALAPVLLTQLLALPVAWGFLGARQYVAAASVALPAIAVLVLLLGSADARAAFR